MIWMPLFFDKCVVSHIEQKLFHYILSYETKNRRKLICARFFVENFERVVKLFNNGYFSISITLQGDPSRSLSLSGSAAIEYCFLKDILSVFAMDSIMFTPFLNKNLCTA